jgi:hypothetical protein
MLMRTIFAALLVVCMFTPHAHAVHGEWTTVASACVPDEAAVGMYSVDGAYFQFLGASTGTIVARCNVTDPADYWNLDNPIWNYMDVTFNGPDGTAVDYQVSESLRRVHETTGSSSTIKTFTSNLFEAGQQLKSATFNHVFDFYNSRAGQSGPASQELQRTKSL